jgi:cation diffusion facilitator family transporter
MAQEHTRQDPLLPGLIPNDRPGSESVVTVAVAFLANALIAVAKSVAALLTGSASLVAESAHSWADTGNEIFLFVAQRRSAKPPDRDHPFGTGREAYVWSLFAALGLFVAGAAVSIFRGAQELIHPRPSENLVVGYVVLAIAFVLEGASFLQAMRQARPEARSLDRDVLEHVLQTSDPTLRAVVAEDSAALIGIVVAAVALVLDQVTGSGVPDAIGSLVIGALLAGIAIALIEQNRRFLVGRQTDPEVQDAVVRSLLADPEIERVTYLWVEFAGPRSITVTADVDLTGDDTERHVAVRLRELERRLTASPGVVGAVLSLSAPDEPSLTVGG